MKCNELVKLGAAICGVGCLYDLVIGVYNFGVNCGMGVAVGLMAKDKLDPERILIGINDEANHIDKSIVEVANKAFNGDYSKKD